ncbi:MAG: hypothetical protein BM564_00735 [Bacteroidetes bacterium MedPE-SWsnd-G2]|nr:MAG: hypothetical protein BM564_00735 [Bacteroidetes bacterium MedPE-SWsnd-G2]
MKAENILIGLLFVTSFSLHAQSTEHSQNLENNQTPKLITTELQFESNNLEDFSTIYWILASEILKHNNPNQDVKLTIVYNTNSTKMTSTIPTGVLKAEFNGKTSELVELMSSELKNTLAAFTVLDAIPKNKN